MKAFQCAAGLALLAFVAAAMEARSCAAGPADADDAATRKCSTRDSLLFQMQHSRVTLKAGQMDALAPGCYLKQPTASSKCGGPFLEWKRDTWGETNANSAASEAACRDRKEGHDAYCGTDTEWYFQSAATSGSPSPTSHNDLAPGCYLKQPTGSSKCGGPFLEWKRDTWGEANENSGASESACMDRKDGHDSYCGTDTEWHFEPAPASEPSPAPMWAPTSASVPAPASAPPAPAPVDDLLPGCYYKQPTASSECGGPFLQWERDNWGMQNVNSGASEVACMARKAGHDAHCGTSTTWKFVAGSSDNVLKVMSYNTQYNGYPGRVGGYGRKIAEVNAAIVGTQECQDKGALARTSGYSVVPDTGFQNPILYNPNLVSYVDGSAGWKDIPRDDYSQRTLTWARFTFGNKEFLHFNTHLPHNHGEAWSRNTHARIAQTLLQQRRDLKAEDVPTVVTGDMNTFASSGASLGSFESNLVAAGFIKSHQATGSTGGHAGLDQIFHTGDDFLLLQGADRGTGGSDHPAIIADLAFSPGLSIVQD